MKVVLAFLALAVCMVAAQDFHTLVRREVHALLQAEPRLTVDECTRKCDALFDLVNDRDEHATDQACHHECDCQINQTCRDHV